MARLLAYLCQGYPGLPRDRIIKELIRTMKPPGLKEKVALLRQSQSEQLPIVYVLKDIHKRFQFMTEIAAIHTGAQSSQELIDRSVLDLNCDAANFAEDFNHYEELCMEQRSETLLLSLIHSAQGATMSLICNKPIINEKGAVDGIETWAQILPSAVSLDKLAQGYQQAVFANSSLESPNSKPLTLREQECIYYLTKGCNFTEIGKSLFISPRTVETHIANIKMKLGVRTRAELIARACELGYLQISILNPNAKPGKLQLLGVKPCEIPEET